jgi:hypothetical protein
MAYVKTSLRKEKRDLRERMRAMGLDYRQIASEFSRVYALRPRAAWREAYGLSQVEAATKFNAYCGDTGLDSQGMSAMTAAHLSEYENWPGPGARPTGRRPSPYFLAVLSEVYSCQATELVDPADRSSLPPTELMVIDTYTRQGTPPTLVLSRAEAIPDFAESGQGSIDDDRKKPNLILRRIREEERQETRSEFADSLAAKAREIGESVQPSERYVARLEDGDIRYPHPAYRRVLVALCERPMSELGFRSGRSNEQSNNQDRERRRPRTDHSAYSEEIRDLMAWVEGTNTTDDAIEQVARAADYLSEAHCEIPPQKVLCGVWQAHQTVEDFLLGGRQRLRQTRELLRIDSELLAYACLILGNLGQHLRATECGKAALVMAQEAGCDEAFAWSAQAKTARWQQKYVESAEAARRGFEVSAPSPTKVELAYREANAIALFGDKLRARQALKRAQQAADAMPANQGSSRSVWSFPTGRQAIFELSVAIHTGDPGSALRAAAMAEKGWANGESKVPATWAQIQVGSSIAYLMQDSLDEVACHVTPILELPKELRISTVIGYLRKLESLLGQPRFAKNNTAAELTLQIRDFISSSPLGMDEPEPR